MKLESSAATEVRGVSGWSAVWMFVILGICILVVGYVSFEIQKRQSKENIGRQLLTITKTKVEQIVTWRNERLGDAAYIYESPFFAMRATAYLSDRSSVTERDMLHRRLLALKWGQRFSRIMLTDKNGAVVLSTEATNTTEGNSIETYVEPSLKSAMKSKDVVISDLYLDTHNTIRLTVVVPILEREPFTGEIAGGVAGALVIDIDPYDGLFPLIQGWPVESDTAETLLVRREGSEVVFLNELRHIRSTAMVFRLPVSDNDLPAAMAVRGQRGIVEGIDYRGHHVLAAVMPVTGTPWFIVSKVDQYEIYAPIVTITKNMSIIVSLLLTLSGMGIGLVWQKRKTNYIKKQHEVEERFRKLFDDSPIGIALWNKEHMFLDVNKKLCEMLQYTADEKGDMTFEGITHSDDLDKSMEMVTRLLNNEIQLFRIEQRYITKTGKVLWGNSTVSTIKDNKRQMLYGLTMIEDITVRKEIEERLIRTNRLYAVLSQVSQAIVRTKDATLLFKEICRICVEYGGFKMAWIGLSSPDRQSVEPIAFAGIDERELNNIVSCIVNRPHWTCPIIAVIRDDATFICNDMATDHAVAACRAEALEKGYLSLGSFPIRKREVAIGALSLGVPQKGFFSDNELKLLEEVALDISFALDVMEDERAREKELKRNKMILDVSMDGYMLVDQAGKILEVNRAFSDLLGYSFDELYSMNVSDIDVGQTNAGIIERIRQIIHDGHIKFETVLRHKDNRRVDVEVSVNCIELDGEIMLFAFHNDITEKKHRDKVFLLNQRKAHMGEMLSIIAHQWKQPISVIGASINKLKVETMFGTLNEAVLKPAIEKIDDMLHHLSQIISDFIGFFKPDKDKELSDIKSVMQKALNIIGEQYKTKGIEVDLRCHSDTRIETYVSELVQVFLSILENARDAFEGKDVANPKVSIDIYDKDARVVVEITDNAGGISPDIIDNIFLPYYTTKGELNGTGLGLYMSNMIIEEHCHGKLCAKNVEGGASFIIELPNHTDKKEQHNNAGR
ncbi:MAG: PAS domain S-box protein [Nitrospirae bacterium]|uniref:PAS domain S-box protein n=1 Tax=Candidatus Magnetobacterium casense TaxID=1455061 RepID=UPI000695E412|nr:PAS domain S-box protein [Candidatus Magnetobacterium casensis]MBF0337150.1 PAS domain S-box protein [Nitrospirota bacterium]